MAEARRRGRPRRGETTRRARFLPFRTARPSDVRLAVEHLVLDGGPTRDGAGDEPVLDLSAHRFDTLHLALRLEVAAGAIRHVLPPGERHDPPLAVAVVAGCAGTRLRAVERIPVPAAGDLEATVTFDLRRADLRGEVTVVAHLVRTREALRPRAGFAGHAAAILGASHPIRLHIDPARRSRGGHLDVRYESFSSMVGFDARTLFRLETERDTPVLWLNMDRPEVRQVLDSRGRTGPVARAREVTFDAVALVVWIRLAASALWALDADGRTAFPWQEAVLREILPALVPEAADHDSRVRAALRLRDEGPAELLAGLEAVVQVRTKVLDHVEALAKEIAR